MHSTRHNCLIYQKTQIRRSTGDSHYTYLRGVYSSQKKATSALEEFREKEYKQLAQFYNTVPTMDNQKSRVVLTVPGQSTTLVLIKVPQDVTTAIEI